MKIKLVYMMLCRGILSSHYTDIYLLYQGWFIKSLPVAQSQHGIAIKSSSHCQISDCCGFENITSLRQPMKLLLIGEPGKSAVLGLPPTQKKSSEPSMVQSSWVQPVVVRIPSTEIVTCLKDTMDKTKKKRKNKIPSNDLTVLIRASHLPYFLM